MNNKWSRYKIVKHRELIGKIFKKSRDLEEKNQKNLGGIGYEF